HADGRLRVLPVTCTRSADPHRESLAVLLVSQGRTALINADGTGLRHLEFDIPNQATWQPADFFSHCHRVLFLSMKPGAEQPAPQDTEPGPGTPQAASESRSTASPVICTSERCGRRMAIGWPTRIASPARTRAMTGRTFA